MCHSKCEKLQKLAFLFNYSDLQENVAKHVATYHFVVQSFNMAPMPLLIPLLLLLFGSTILLLHPGCLLADDIQPSQAYPGSGSYAGFVIPLRQQLAVMFLFCMLIFVGLCVLMDFFRHVKS